MKKTKSILMAVAALVVLAVSACGGAPEPAQQAAPPVVQVQPTQEAAIQPSTNVEQPAPQQSFAPACAAATSCSAPAVTDTVPTETFCVKKVPYQNILAPVGTVFEPQPKTGDPKDYPLICDDSKTDVDVKRVFTCRGAQLWTYDLKVTNQGCSSADLQTGTTMCQADQGYDSANNCCAPLTTAGGGSVVIKVNMGACPLPQ